MIALLVAGAVALVFTLLLTPLFIKLFHRLGWGQFIRDDGPQSHHTKRGTATMGGIVLIIGAVLGYFVGHLVGRDSVTLSGLLVLFLMVGLGFVGFIDDFLKVRRQRSLGLGGWAKVLGQVIVGVVFATIALVVPTGNGKPPASTMISAIRDVPWLDFMVLGTVIGTILYLAWIVLLTVSTSNGVNVADGLDGLATGSSILAIGSYVIIGFWQSNQICGGVRLDESTAHACYSTSDPLDLAVVAAAVCGGLIGFLWYNTSPAQIFLGDTGSLGLGGALAGLAILSRTELLLILIGGLFFIVTGSVILQRAYFKITHGKRIFRMSPLHHHFELKGWAEVTVVVRFWIIAGLCVAAGVGLFYLEWIARVG
ncbi:MULTISPECIES: phospho-N-acetylmuramoyl-pentapeptide-transferase [unclassified Curtobacterium]|jgi:phospho-N-acetylmuramoyl-pentapeptide-transferase|uniref:phospho-N-acetylmuramoyl-pentapeptide- transferase n=1 Tax=unclassified Curtobacterium TaxID=257496 RepID=UPI00052A351D|nr:MULTISPECIES: phospho-N-acetylmuramoyl-pentapeptide-transferase [unclassified Curtobacterium]AIV39920.1 phospho-N-acetylmuramoyl-pentapeptide-transferase [Curtobacterium sp. MR_MD2014]MBP1300681.1 phospho-N-acetylmuramoyl-pentapeptide-transferase [Curtobacterium sp. 1310]MCM3504980.1 phospho-N-acetylmuramoyl-pentapeptide-transferase [Curtobacterium sp. ODYSSEY 48 V2]MCM3521395.1 phospho-N-acetylmuramoyl-pentapeptide-transferase [Curtobacterium sp. P97]MDB6428583.1 phospho-N-acetylmuramoyl-p